MKAVISGTGQDSSYLAELLVEKGYEVHFLARRKSDEEPYPLIDHLLYNGKAVLHYCDIADCFRVFDLIDRIRPDEVYNLAAQSHVKDSFDIPIQTFTANTTGTLSFLEAIRKLKGKKDIKFYQASSSEMIGLSEVEGQNESTPFHPRSPYAVSKLASHWLTINYRESYNLFVVSGIIYNHESPRRGVDFVTRKITKAIADIHYERADKIVLGNLDAKRDWSHAKDMVNAMWMMLQNDTPKDYVVGSGEAHSIKEFIIEAFIYYNANYGGNLTLTDSIAFDEKFLRPSEVPYLQSDPSKIKEELGWEPKYSFKDLVHEMVDSDIRE